MIAAKTSSILHDETNQELHFKAFRSFQNHRNSRTGRTIRRSQSPGSRQDSGELGMIPQEIIDECCEGDRYCNDNKHILYKSRQKAQDLYLDRENGNIEVISSEGWETIQ